MIRRFLVVALAAAVALLALAGCFDTLTQPSRGNPADPANPATASREPPRPTGLAAVVSDRHVDLTWIVTDESRIDHYNVYRWEVEDEEKEYYELLDTADTMEYEDDGVRNGQEYSYKVSGVNSFGLEGKLSSERRVTPRIHSVSIDQGRAKTGSRSVALTLSASETTELMQTSNTSNMLDAQWVPYQLSLSWLLPAGDGVKTVYARFRDDEDAESEIVSDDIELDTRAMITALTEDTGGQVLYAGDEIHFLLDAGEPFGEAYVDIGTAVSGIALYDDGTGGDSVADDGIYERDYVVDHGVEAVNAAVYGHFTDEVGNDAESEIAPGTVTIHEPPTSVTMNAPTTLSERRVALSWSRNTDSDFGSYRLYRSYIPGVDTSGEREQIAQLTSQSQTSFNDSDLEPGSTYYYAVYVVDDIGLTALSNEVAGTTLANEPPTAVELYSPWAPDTTSLMLSWSQSDDDDFDQYELLGWEQDPPNPPDTAAKRVIARFGTRGETFYTHGSLIDTLVYWYEVAVIDSFGSRALSNSVSGSPRPSSK
jgi:fibronectin type 3 domain-containing protein